MTVTASEMSRSYNDGFYSGPAQASQTLADSTILNDNGSQGVYLYGLARELSTWEIDHCTVKDNEGSTGCNSITATATRTIDL